MLYSRVLRQDSTFHKKNFLDSGFQRQNFSRLQNSDSGQQLLDEAPGCPEVQPLTLLYSIFHEKGTPFVYLLLINGTPFTYLVKNFASILTAVNALSFK